MKYKLFTFMFFLTLFVDFGYSQETINQYDSNGKRHGVWKKNFEGTNKVRYQGKFEHGKEVGLFKFYKLIKNKSSLTATKEFNTNDNTAYVKFLTSRGKVISEGMMNERLYIGKWIYYHKNSEKIMSLENYNDQGQLHGEKKVFYDNGRLAEHFNYYNGNLNGEAKYYAVNGTLVKYYIYENNELHGWSKHFDEEGDLLVEGRYKNGKKSGIWKYYNNGKLVKEHNFDYIPKRKRSKKD